MEDINRRHSRRGRAQQITAKRIGKQFKVAIEMEEFDLQDSQSIIQ